MDTKAEEQKIEDVMPQISLWVIGLGTVLGLVLSIVIESVLPSFNKVLIGAMMLIIVTADLLIARFVNLPGLTRTESPRSNLVTVGYAQAMFAGVVAAFGGIVVGEWWLPLLLGAIGFACWFAVRDYLGPPPVSGS